MTPRHDARCPTCQRQFTADSWIDRHTISDTGAHDHDLEAGDHHDGCCPLCSRDDEAVR